VDRFVDRIVGPNRCNGRYAGFDIGSLICGISAGSAPGTLGLATFNPLVQGSTPGAPPDKT
jgi:hypothetical protein